MGDAPASSGTFLGVDKDLLERCLILLRDKYPLADKANYFLERQGYAGINITITNQRDALSHLVTLLSDHTLDRDGQLAQLHNAEEHLRRAMTEPYERAIDIKFSEVLEKRERYIEHVVPRLDTPDFVGSLPLERIDNKLRYAQSRREEGRALKARNKWDEEWENGIKRFLEAFECLEEIERSLSESISRARAAAIASRGLSLSSRGLWVGVAGIGIGIVLAILF
jgi:coenzyme F420-reducing hydrogenase alpha subunit